MAKKNISSVHERISKEIASHSNLIVNASRKTFIKDSVDNKECVVSKYGTLATWTPVESTGRSPKDTYAVKRASSEMHIDWTSPNNLPIEEDTFDMLLDDALAFAKESDRLYVTERVIGADSKYALPVKLITDKALPGLFADNMFRPVPKDISKSCFASKPYFLLALPYRKLDQTKYTGRLRKLADGTTSDLVVAMDFDRGIGIVIGTAYLGSIKKLMFTVMNYYLPFEGVLPLHCSANEGKDGKSALILGLSGTGKTTLSADPSRALLGDDEHGWSEDGIANFENGCYAKMININPKKEPDIYKAVLHQADYLKHGAIIENAMMYPNGEFDFDDERLTPNSRASYPLTSIKNIKKSSTAGHPSTILFLTADAYGVIPPVSKLDKSQAMLWFLMGYTSKVAGTERGVVEPSATFSRFFGQPFMPGLPSVYTKMLGEKMEKFNTSVYLINTGWTAGKFGVGHRIDLVLTRKMVNAALNGDLEKVDYIYDKLFHLSIPVSCPGVPSEILNPINTWKDPEDFRKTANELAQKFSKTFDDSFGKGHIDPLIRKNCPGK